MTTLNRRDWAVAVGGDCMHVSVSVCLRLQLYSIMREVNKQNIFYFIWKCLRLHYTELGKTFEEIANITKNGLWVSHFVSCIHVLLFHARGLGTRVSRP